MSDPNIDHEDRLSSDADGDLSSRSHTNPMSSPRDPLTTQDSSVNETTAEGPVTEQEIVDKYTQNKDLGKVLTPRQRIASMLHHGDLEPSKHKEPVFSGEGNDHHPHPESVVDDERHEPHSCCDSLKNDVIKAAKSHWLVNYKDNWRTRKWLQKDISTGVLLGVLFVPQGLSYGLLAEMPAYYGLYAAFMPIIIYAFLGASNELSIGPFALISLMIADSVGKIVDPYLADGSSNQEYVDAVLTIGFMVGMILMLMGMLRLGVIVNFLSAPVLSSLTTAGSFLIATSQMKHLFGISISSTEGFFLTWRDIVLNIKEINWATFLIGFGSFVIMILVDLTNRKVKFLRKRQLEIPAALVCVIVMIAFMAISNFGKKYHVHILGPIPSGLPSPKFPSLWNKFTDLLPGAITIALVGFSMSYATGKVLVEMRDRPGYKLPPNRELFAHGFANMIGAIFLAYPSFSSLSRSALAYGGGVETPVHNLVAAIIIVVVLTLLTMAPILDWLPFSTLAAIILYSLRTVFKKILELPALYRADFNDFLVWVATFIAVLALDVAFGLAVGVLFSFLMLVKNASYPPYSILGQLPQDERVYKDIKRFPDANLLPGIVIFRFDSALHFANQSPFRKALLKAVKRRKNIRFLILDAGSIAQVDSTALRTVKKLVGELKGMGVQIVITKAKWRFRDALEKSKMNVPRFLTNNEAVLYAKKCLSERQANGVNGGINGSSALNALGEHEAETEVLHEVFPLPDDITNDVAAAMEEGLLLRHRHDREKDEQEVIGDLGDHVART